MKREEAHKLIAEYQQNRTTALRNRIIEAYLPLVENFAKLLRARIHNRVELGDLIASGAFGLMDALERFDLSRGIAFGTFAAARVRGRMLDDIRSYDPISRNARARMKKTEDAIDQFRVKHGRPPALDELAQQMDLPPRLFERITRAYQCDPISLETQKRNGDNFQPLKDLIIERNAPNLDAKMDAHSIILHTIKHHGLMAALLLKLRFLEGCTLVETAEALGGITECGMSYRQRYLLSHLRAEFSPLQLKALAGRAA